MILNISGRTDIPAFYSQWFLNRLKIGYLDIRNPYYPKLVTRIKLTSDTIDAIIFCTKNPIPIMPYLNQIPFPFLFQITITPYGKEIEPGVPPKGLLIQKVKELSSQIGKEKIYLRYDPIFLNPTYTIEYHIQKFEQLLQLLHHDISKIIISFLDFKKNTKNHQNSLKAEPFTLEKITIIAQKFGEIAQKYQLPIQTCAEDYPLEAYGIQTNVGCIDSKTIATLIGKEQKLAKNTTRKNCHCIKTIDIGAYNSCPHLCKYCYANYDEKQITTNFQSHHKQNSLLIGNLKNDDIIKEKCK